MNDEKIIRPIDLASKTIIGYTDENFTLLHLAAQKGAIDEVCTQVVNGANIDAVSSRGKTPLEFAAENGHIEVVKFLLAKGAKVNTISKSGTPISAAITNGRTNVIKVLLDYGANINLPIIDGATHLHIACFNGNYNIVKVLLDNGANINAADDDNKTPMDYAIEGSHNHIIKILTDRQKNANAISHVQNKDLNVENLKDEIQKHFGNNGSYKTRTFPMRHDHRVDLIKEVDALIKSNKSFYEMLKDLKAIGAKAQHHHETESGWRNLFTGELINKVCGLQDAVNKIVKATEVNPANEKTSLLKGL